MSFLGTTRLFARSLPCCVRPTRLARQAPAPFLYRHFSRAATPNVLAPPPRPLSTILQFASSRLRQLRTTYYPDRRRSSFGGKGSGGNGSAWSRFRARLDAIPNNVIFYSIMAINGIVFAAWNYSISSYNQFRDAGKLKFMFQNFTVSWANITSGHVWTLVTSCFSHSDWGHIITNGLTFFFMAPTVLGFLGNTAFLALYLGGGLACSVTSLVLNMYLSPNQQTVSKGASGSVYAVLSFFACAFPRTTFLLFFIVPVPAWACVGGFFAWDLYSTFMRRGGKVDSAGHVGGILGGVLFYLRLRGRMF